MTFRNPAAWIGLAALLIPIAIHLLVRAPALPIVLPSLRFVSVSPMRALRRRLLNDGGLLALRVSILLLAVAALADPLATPACRRAAWNARVTRAVIADPTADTNLVRRTQNEPAALASAVITTDDPASGLARALVWLDAAPPARREVVFVGPLTIGAVDETVLHTAPRATGLRFVRSAVRSGPATITAARVTTADARRQLIARSPQVTFEGDRLVTASGAASPLPGDFVQQVAHGWRAPALDVDLIGPDAIRAHLRASLVAAIAAGVALPAAGVARPIVVMVDPGGDVDAFAPRVEPLSAAWMAGVAEAMGRDAGLARELRGLTAVAAAAPADPWRTVLRGDDGRVLASVAATPAPRAALVLRVRTSASSPAPSALLRSALNAALDTRPLVKADPLPIPDARLAAWTRPAGDVDERIPGAPLESDRRWLWGAALVALAIEALFRRRTTRTGSAHESGSHERAA